MGKATNVLCLAAMVGAGCGSSGAGGSTGGDAGTEEQNQGSGQQQGGADAGSMQANQPQGGPCGKGSFPAESYNGDYNFCPSTDPADKCLPFSQAEGYTVFPEDMYVHDVPDLKPLACATLLGNSDFVKVANLTDLSQLKNIKEATELHIMNDPALTSVAGLDSLTAVDTLHFKQLDNLKDFRGLKSGVKVQNLIIENCNGLTSLAGIETLTVTEYIYIQDNASLPQCEADRIAKVFASVSDVEVKGGNTGTGTCN